MKFKTVEELLERINELAIEVDGLNDSLDDVKLELEDLITQSSEIRENKE
jgi:hypothetical protein